MNEATSSSLFLRRQNDLKRKISEALDLKEEKLFSVLEAQWVHRYGVGTLPMIYQSLNPLDEVTCYQTESDLEFQKIEDETVLQESSSQAMMELNDEACELDPLSPSIVNNNGDACLAPPFECEENFSNEVELEQKSFRKLVSPPPPPSLNRLRRWLPVLEDDLRKAS